MAEQTRIFSYPVWHTQGGGLVRNVNGTYIFVEKPHPSLGLDVGDTMPDEFGLAPANELAVQAMERDDDFGEYDLAMEDYIHRGHQPTGRA